MRGADVPLVERSVGHSVPAIGSVDGILIETTSRYCFPRATFAIRGLAAISKRFVAVGLPESLIRVGDALLGSRETSRAVRRHHCRLRAGGMLGTGSSIHDWIWWMVCIYVCVSEEAIICKIAEMLTDLIVVAYPRAYVILGDGRQDCVRYTRRAWVLTWVSRTISPVTCA